MAKDKKALIEGKMATFGMDIRREQNAPVHHIKCTIDFENVEPGEMARILFSGSSARVRIQSRLRSKTERELKGLEETGFRAHWNDALANATPSPQDTLAKLTFRQFFETLKDYGVSKKHAVEMYANKHGLNPDQVNTEE